MVQGKLVPPDGGYGWVITAACGLYYFITLPIVQGQFGLILKESFNHLEFSAASISLIMNTNAAFQMFVGIIVAPLLKHLGYRQVSLIAGGLITTGVFLTAYASSFTQYIITFGLITALGYGMGVQAYTLAQNIYFVRNRTKAMGYSLTICGFGPVIMPQIISFLMQSYGVKGAIIIMASISTHTIVSGLLLQPIKWHLKREIEEDASDTEIESLLQEEIHRESISVSLRKKCIIHQKIIQGSLDVDRIQIIQQGEADRNGENRNMHNMNNHNNVSLHLTANRNLFEEENENMGRPILERIGKRIVEILDLTLLKDLTFVNIIIGMSFAVFAELNFSILTPFIMCDFGLTTQEIATFLSTISAADICFRFLTPYINDFLAQPVRVMYLWSLTLLILSRFCLLLADNYNGLLLCAVFLGISKGFRTVYWSLVIPNSVPIERLAAASGLQSTFNSFLIWIGGPFLGSVKDLTGSYKNCIFVVNIVTFFTIILWNAEFACKRQFRRKLVESKFGI